jgi:hypothetical protein
VRDRAVILLLLVGGLELKLLGANGGLEQHPAAGVSESLHALGKSAVPAAAAFTSTADALAAKAIFPCLKRSNACRLSKIRTSLNVSPPI